MSFGRTLLWVILLLGTRTLPVFLLIDKPFFFFKKKNFVNKLVPEKNEHEERYFHTEQYKQNIVGRE